MCVRYLVGPHVAISLASYAVSLTRLYSMVHHSCTVAMLSAVGSDWQVTVYFCWAVAEIRLHCELTSRTLLIINVYSCICLTWTAQPHMLTRIHWPATARCSQHAFKSCLCHSTDRPYLADAGATHQINITLLALLYSLVGRLSCVYIGSCDWQALRLIYNLHNVV